RRGMWNVVRDLRDSGVTVILTTHYIEEAEGMADRVGVINNGELLLVEDKAALMDKLGEKRLTVHVVEPLEIIPESLADYGLERVEDGYGLVYSYHPQDENSGVPRLLRELEKAGVCFTDLNTQQSSLEEIFVN